MKITNVRAVQPHSPGCPPDWRAIMGQIVVAVDTDRGLTGFGVGGGGAAGIHVVVKLLRDLLIGQDPTRCEALCDRMYRATLPFGRKGLAIMALSGVDLALWDLRGKAEGVSVARLLSDTPHQHVPCYATVGDDPQHAIASGFRAVKVHFSMLDNPTDRNAIVDTVSRTRVAIGADVRLMTDGFMKWNVPLTLDVAQEFARLGVEWLEEPLEPDDLDGYAQLAGKCPVPIAGGEHEYTSRGFRELVERRLHTVLQPDVTWCGGMTELVRIYELARKADLRVCQHRGSEIWGLHAVAALEPTDPLAESGRPWINWVLDAPEIHDGMIEIPDRPGFGIRIDAAALP